MVVFVMVPGGVRWHDVMLYVTLWCKVVRIVLSGV